MGNGGEKQNKRTGKKRKEKKRKEKKRDEGKGEDRQVTQSRWGFGYARGGAGIEGTSIR